MKVKVRPEDVKVSDIRIEGDKPVGKTAILFELETLAVNSRQITYEVVANVMDEKGVRLTPGIFSRKCLNTPPRWFVPELLKDSKKRNVNADEIAKEIRQGVILSLADGKVKMNEQFRVLLDMAGARGLRVGMLSCSTIETATNLLTKYDLMTEDMVIYPLSCDSRNFPSTDSWLQLAKKMSVHPSVCVAVATSSYSCKAALSAGMRCAVVPDSFTGFQDFGGADFVYDSLDAVSAESIIRLLETD